MLKLQLKIIGQKVIRLIFLVNDFFESVQILVDIFYHEFELVFVVVQQIEYLRVDLGSVATISEFY